MREVVDPVFRHSEGENLYSNTSILTRCVHKALSEVTSKEALSEELLKHVQLTGPVCMPVINLGAPHRDVSGVFEGHPDSGWRESMLHRLYGWLQYKLMAPFMHTGG
jgi:hypothetical protein